MFTEEGLKKFTNLMFEKHGDKITRLTKNLMEQPYLSFDERAKIMDDRYKLYKNLVLYKMFKYCRDRIEEPNDGHPRDTWETQLEAVIDEEICKRLLSEIEE